jgi:tetratricopeptide (TPR) repeat protein
MGRLRAAQGKLPEAEQFLSKALDHQPDSVEALRDIAWIDAGQKQPAKAIARINAQIEKNPKVVGFYDLLALFQSNNNDLSGAEQTLEKALAMQPLDPTTIQMYATFFASHGHPERAQAALEAWVKAHPQDGAAYATLGTLAEQIGNRTKAESLYQKALQLQPDQPTAANNLAFMYMEQNTNLDVALGLAQVARRAMPESPNSADTLAWAYYLKGTYASARDLLEQAVKQNPQDAIIQYHLGAVYNKLEDHASATAHLKKALTLSPAPRTAEQIKKELSNVT